MQNWFFIALLAPLLWSFINHIDKHLLSKYSGGKGVGAIMLFSSLYSVLALPIIAFFFRAEILNLPAKDLAMLLLVGVLGAGAFYFYLRAMDIEEASVVAPLLQIIPVFGYVLGYAILGESLSRQQIIFSLLILIGMLIISFEIDLENKFVFKKKAVALVALSSFLFALDDVLFKMVAIQNTFWVSAFWQYTGLFLVGAVIFIASSSVRQEFLQILYGKNLNRLSFNITSETLYILGNIANNYASLLAPVALVLVVSGYQPLFVFIEGSFLTYLFPKIFKEKISIKHLSHKLLSIVIIVLGTYLLYTSS